MLNEEDVQKRLRLFDAEVAREDLRDWYKLPADTDPHQLRGWVRDRLRTFDLFLRVEAEFMSSGIWDIQFPGRYATTPMYGLEHFDLTAEARWAFRQWIGLYDKLDPSDERTYERFDWEAFDREGERLAAELKAAVGDRAYVEYHPLREATLLE